MIAASVLSLFLNFQPGEDPSRVYYGSDTRCFALLIGGLIGLRHRPQRKRRESRPHLYVIAFLILLVIQLLPYFVADGERPETYWLLLFPTAWIGAALIDLCANRCFSFGRLLDVPLLSWVGKRSYELYLIQYPILIFCSAHTAFEIAGWQQHPCPFIDFVHWELDVWNPITNAITVQKKEATS